jgi:pimeloyl-ACP methyl ester carboxylesterase
MKENYTNMKQLHDPISPGKEPDNHILLLNGGDASLPVFLIPGSGGLSDSYFELARAFGNIAVYGLHMMGTQPGDTPLRTIREVARCNIRCRQVQPQGPYTLLGHSFGANVAYEMALQLEQSGHAVSFVAILDAWAGLSGIRLSDEHKIGFVLNLAADYYRDFDIIGEPYPEWVHDIPAIMASLGLDDMVPCIGHFLKSKLPELADNIDFVTRLINLRLYNAQMDYRPEQRVNSAIIVFKSGITDEESEKAMGWGPFSDNVHMIALPGNHDMLNKDNVAAISHDLKKRILEKLKENDIHFIPTAQVNFGAK